MPTGDVSRAFLERTLDSGPIGGVNVGVPLGHVSYRRDATATGCAV